MSPTTLTVGIISDLHAYETAEAGNRPSHLCLNSVDSEPTKHPLPGLHKLIADNGLSVDILLCCGDLGNKAHPAAIRYAWNAVHDLKARLRASKLFATVGNHDVDSRNQFNAFDPKGFLQSLTPSFPFETQDLNDTFWSRNFALYTDSIYRVAVLNSSAFHGGGEDELKHGRVSDYTLAALRLALEGGSSKLVNILLCHHHPQQHMELNLGEYDVMKSGQLLLDLLGSGAFGDWIVIHGHKHHPKLSYAAGGSSAPVIFSSGSFSATLYTELQTVARNQFYILELPISMYQDNGTVGRYRAWDWASGHGWIPARENSGLPHIGGFGYRGTTRLLAQRISKQIGDQSMTWSALREKCPELDFLIPVDQRALLGDLRNLNLGVQLDANGLPFEIGPKP